MWSPRGGLQNHEPAVFLSAHGALSSSTIYDRAVSKATAVQQKVMVKKLQFNCRIMFLTPSKEFSKMAMSSAEEAPTVSKGNRLDSSDSEEMLLRHNPSRFVIFPIQHKEIWDMYKKHMASFWTTEEVFFPMVACLLPLLY
jgi:hypothetical protein